MLTTQQPVLRRFWHAVMPLRDLERGPQPFRLMGEDIVLFLDAAGQPAALADRCAHRTAKLSRGWCERGALVCGYHGWTYDRDGNVLHIPQNEPQHGAPRSRTAAYRATAAYGYAWVALGEPLVPIFSIPEEGAAGYRRVDQFYERWNTSSLRLMENSFDSAHFSFVHRTTFGDPAQPIPSLLEIEETDFGFRSERTIGVVNPPAAHRITGSTEPSTVRHVRNEWYLPFSRRLDIEYPSGIRHIIITSATPIDDTSLQLVQFVYRNDTEADCPAELVVAWDKQVVAEDQEMLESLDPDATIDVSRRIEEHMPSDRPGLIMRKRLLALLHAHGEAETTYAASPGQSASQRSNSGSGIGRAIV